MEEATIKFGKRMNVAHEQKNNMIAAGFIDVQEEIHKVRLPVLGSDLTDRLQQLLLQEPN